MTLAVWVSGKVHIDPPFDDTQAVGPYYERQMWGTSDVSDHPHNISPVIFVRDPYSVT